MKLVATIEPKISLNVMDKDIEDIITTALYGGIDYWCSDVEICGEEKDRSVSEHLLNGGKVRFIESEPADDGRLNPIGLDDILKGIKDYIEGDYVYSYDIIDQATNGLETTMVDAEVADCIIQLAVFGEIVYG